MTRLKEWLQRLKGQQQELRTSQDIDRVRRPGRTKSPKVFFLSNMACVGILLPLV